MNILVTGAAGFIAFNFCKSILALKEKVRIIGVDNINSYYSVKVKKKRISFLKKNKDFTFIKLDISDKKKLSNIFLKNNISEIYNFAAQAGVRYSMENPGAYINSNVLGFANLINLGRENNVKKFFYASSSSVYGDSNKFPLKENLNLKPKNLYGLTKKHNEEMAAIYYDNFNFKTIGLRFFTVFGEWGRPDMFLYKLLASKFNNKKFVLNNNGNHFRDFTYISDVIEIILKLRKKKLKGCEVLNVCSNKPVGLLKIINFLQKRITFKKIIYGKKQDADIIKTHGDNKLIIKKTGYKNFTDTNVALVKTLNWYKKNKKLFN